MSGTIIAIGAGIAVLTGIGAGAVSHYDHVAGLPAVRKAWPGMKTYASERAKEILVKPGALKTIRRLSGEAAEAAGLPCRYRHICADAGRWR